MASSMITGDRRWTTTRKTGLTVLGKVPKPINLPSQRLENHGLDPNVEIVPKGTLTWGSRPSLAAPNAWGASSVASPNAEGDAGSPRHRPSSGGSGTRPSTADSDRSHEPLANAWGSNSRPSSASGILASSQISAATRPRSAETRPGSSQLSRFADNSVDNTLALGAVGTAERLGTVTSKSGGFNLSPGDFPTLGSDMNSDTHSQRGHSSQGRPHSSQSRPHSSQERPASASGTDSKQKELLESPLADHSDGGTVNTWKADNPPYSESGVSPNMENWHRDSHPSPPFPNISMPPPHYDSWHNLPFHPGDGAWYRGGASGGPYRPPGPPASYPPDYPHVPSRPLSNPQFPRQNAGPGRFYPNNCEPYHPYMPPARYMGPSCPDIPVRQGAYSGPVPYERYYGPPRPNFCNSTEREASIMGMARPVGHYQYPSQYQNHESVNFHARPGGYASIGNKEQRNPDLAHETQGQYRVLLKQHDGSEEHDELEKREHSVRVDSPHFQKGFDPTGVPTHRDLGTRGQMQEANLSANLPPEVVSSQPASGVEGQSTDSAVRNTLANSRKAADEGLLERPEAANTQSCDLQQYPVIKKNATLMEKVEGLNNKARIADSHGEGGAISSKEKPACFKDVTAKVDQFPKVACIEANSAERVARTHHVKTDIPRESNILSEETNQGSTGQGKNISAPFNSVGSGNFSSHKKVQVAGSVDHRARVRSNRHGNDEWMEKPLGSASSMNATTTTIKYEALESDASQGASEKQEFCHVASGRDGSHATPSLDPVDDKAQRAKMRERAIQRAKQLQLAEEERTREQKAKALAKLQELNRRTLAESSNLMSSHAPLQVSDVPNCKQESEPSAFSSDTTSNEALSGTAACHSETMKRVNDSGNKKPELSSDLSHNLAANASHPATQSSSVGQETNATTNITKGMVPDIQHNKIVKQMQAGYRKKHGDMQKQMITSGNQNPKDGGEIAVIEAGNDTLPNNEDPPAPHKKRNNKSAGNNNNKLDEDIPNSNSPPPAHTEGNFNKHHTESGMTRLSVAEAISAPSESSNKTVETLSSKEVTEEARCRVSNHLKPHPQRKMSRNQQTNKPVAKYHVAEAVMWAPVKPQGKGETSQEVGQNIAAETTKELSVKSGNDLQNGQKTKRAEIERYVPKPVAKELSQQVNSQQIPPSINLQTVDSGCLDGSTVNKAAVASSDAKNWVNSKHNKHGKAIASWRQRSSAESPSVAGSGSSDQAKIGQKASELSPAENIDRIPKEPLTRFDDGWNDNGDNVQPSEPVTSTVDPRSFGANRQRRQPYKVHKVSYSVNLQQRTGDKSESQSPSFGHNVYEGRNAGVEPLRPHWQPKSQTYRRENKTTELAPPDVGYQGEQAVMLGVSQRGQYSGRSQWTCDASCGGGDVGQDACEQNIHMHDSDKQKGNNQLLEHQRIGSYNKPSDSFQQNPSSREGVNEASRVTRSRYRGRERNFSRGGGQFHGRSAGAATRAGDSYGAT